MKFFPILALGIALTCSARVPADAGFDASQFGHMKAVLDNCAKVNPRGASAYLLQIKSLIGDASKDMVEQAAMTGEYQLAYQNISAQLSSMPPEQLASTCSAYLEQIPPPN